MCAARCRTRETRAAMWGDTLPASNLYYLSTDGQKQMQINLSPAAMAWFVHRYCALPICSVNVNGWREDPCFSCGWVRAANDPSALTITEKAPSRGREVLMSSWQTPQLKSSNSWYFQSYLWNGDSGPQYVMRHECH